MNDSTRSILGSAGRFFSGTLLSRISGMLRDISMAYAFGTQPAIAAFMLAFRLSHLFRRLFGEGAFQSAFIPEFEALRHRSSQQAFHFFRDLKASLTLFLTLLIMFLSLILGAFLFWGDLSEGNHEVVFLTLLMLPGLLFICLYGLNAGLLQCEKNYFVSGVAPVAFNVIWIIAVMALGNMETKSAMPWLAVGVVIACIAQWLLTLPKTYAIVKQNLGGIGKINLFSDDLIKMIKPLSLGILGVAATQINIAVDSLFARYADPEGPAILWYAIRIEQLPLALFGIALGGAVLPPLSRALKKQDWANYSRFLKYALTATFALMIPLTAAIFILGDTSINLIYGHGDFDSVSALETTKCLWAYGAGLLPAAMVLILAPACYADRNYRSPAVASIITMLLNAGLNAIFILQFGLGAVSVAIATSISSWINLIYLGAVLNKKIPLFSSQLIIDLGKMIAATMAASVAAYLLREQFFEQPVLYSFSNPFLDQITSLTASGMIFALLIGGFIYRKTETIKDRA